MFQKETTFRSEKYLHFVRQQDCCNCGIPANVNGMDAHHISSQNLGGGMGLKISDAHVISLCRRCHNMIHQNQSMIDQQRNALLMLDRALRTGVLVLAK